MFTESDIIDLYDQFETRPQNEKTAGNRSSILTWKMELDSIDGDKETLILQLQIPTEKDSIFAPYIQAKELKKFSLREKHVKELSLIFRDIDKVFLAYRKLVVSQLAKNIEDYCMYKRLKLTIASEDEIRISFRENNQEYFLCIRGIKKEIEFTVLASNSHLDDSENSAYLKLQTWYGIQGIANDIQQMIKKFQYFRENG